MSIVFVESNVWIYALMGQQDPQKYAVAKPFTELPNLFVSVQVINEVCVNLIRKAQFDEIEIKKVIESFYTDCDVVSLDINVFFKASDLRQQYNFSYYDSLIVAAALTANATTLYSEDMHDGLVVEKKLKITNPF